MFQKKLNKEWSVELDTIYGCAALEDHNTFLLTDKFVDVSRIGSYCVGSDFITNGRCGDMCLCRNFPKTNAMRDDGFEHLNFFSDDFFFFFLMSLCFENHEVENK